ncbi:MAG: hypothetical protein AAF914_04010, partial [Pseudomonadota bacterium]
MPTGNNSCDLGLQSMNIATRDQDAYMAARDSSPQELLVYAAKKSGRSPIALQADFQKLASTPNKINLVEYVRNGLFDLDRFTAEERADFLSNDLH